MKIIYLTPEKLRDLHDFAQREGTETISVAFTNEGVGIGDAFFTGLHVSKDTKGMEVLSINRHTFMRIIRLVIAKDSQEPYIAYHQHEETNVIILSSGRFKGADFHTIVKYDVTNHTFQVIYSNEQYTFVFNVAENVRVSQSIIKAAIERITHETIYTNDTTGREWIFDFKLDDYGLWFTDAVFKDALTHVTMNVSM